jgi:pterin-4a-carbinolamine dehydratase
MKQLLHLHEKFIGAARTPMTFGKLPIFPHEAEVPIIAVNKWSKTDSALSKTFVFRLKEQRNDFIMQLLDHEVEIGHHATITIKNDSVSLRLQTENISSITELDKEFSKWADELYRDIVYNSQHD